MWLLVTGNAKLSLTFDITLVPFMSLKLEVTVTSLHSVRTISDTFISGAGGSCNGYVNFWFLLICFFFNNWLQALQFVATLGFATLYIVIYYLPSSLTPQLYATFRMFQMNLFKLELFERRKANFSSPFSLCLLSLKRRRACLLSLLGQVVAQDVSTGQGNGAAQQLGSKTTERRRAVAARKRVGGGAQRRRQAEAA